MAAMATATAEVPTWEQLAQGAAATPTGERLAAEEASRSEGSGAPHTDARLRLFGGAAEEVRVTLYRDHAAWCPYCQKVWMLLEEKRIPYRVEKINMRSYGDKPRAFLEKVPNGLLPAIELDGRLLTDSIPIMLALERTFDDAAQHAPMLPAEEAQLQRANELMGLERELFGAWCTFVFRGGRGWFGGAGARGAFEAKLSQVDQALGEAEGPWFLGGEVPSIVDLQFVSHVERMNASVLYWKGLQLRGSGRWKNLDRWFDAFEQRPSYQASKSDYYTHVRDIPPQYGDGVFEEGEEVARLAAMLDGRAPSSPWNHPDRAHPSATSLEPLSAPMDAGPEAARQEAAYKLARNSAAVARFACRGRGSSAGKQFQAPLADPYCEPDLAFLPAVELALRIVADALLHGRDAQNEGALLQGVAVDQREGAVDCLRYLQERVGVPRDMSYPAAMQLRAHLSWAMRQLQ